MQPDHSLDPPYKEMIAMAFNLRLLQGHRSEKKAGLTRDELRGKILEGLRGCGIGTWAAGSSVPMPDW